jgi:hypothetical protein
MFKISTALIAIALLTHSAGWRRLTTDKLSARLVRSQVLKQAFLCLEAFARVECTTALPGNVTWYWCRQFSEMSFLIRLLPCWWPEKILVTSAPAWGCRFDLMWINGTTWQHHLLKRPCPFCRKRSSQNVVQFRFIQLHSHFDLHSSRDFYY